MSVKSFHQWKISRQQISYATFEISEEEKDTEYCGKDLNSQK